MRPDPAATIAGGRRQRSRLRRAVRSIAVVGTALAGLLLPADEGSAGRKRKWIGRDPVAVDVSIGGDRPWGGDAGGIVISANGRVVAFHSPARDVTTQYGGGRYHVYVRDLREPRAVMASTSSDRLAAAAGDSLWPVLDSIGRYLAFVSDADDLVPGDRNGQLDVFRRDGETGEVVAVSVNAAGTSTGDAASYVMLGISADGRFVLFTSDASDLVDAPAETEGNLFVRDVRKGETMLVTRNLAGSASGRGSERFRLPFGPAVLSADGRFVAFASDADDMVPGDGNGRTDVFVRDLHQGVTERVSTATGAGAGGNGDSLYPAISRHGRYVVFESDASDLVAGDRNGERDMFVRDRRRGVTSLVSVSIDGAGSGNGRSLAGRGEYAPPSLSRRGRFVAFSSTATDLVRGADGEGQAVFLRDLRRKRTYLVSATRAGERRSGGGPFVSANGRVVWYRSAAPDILPDEYRHIGGAYVWSRRKRKSMRANVSRSGSVTGVLSADGRIIAYSAGRDEGPGTVFARRIKWRRNQ